jgi:hypothetical protein
MLSGMTRTEPAEVNAVEASPSGSTRKGVRKCSFFYLTSVGEKFMLSGMKCTESTEVNAVEASPSGKNRATLRQAQGKK